MDKITILVKTGYGAGPQYSYDVSAVPRMHENIFIPSADGKEIISKDVIRIDHDLATDKVIIFTE